MEQLLKLLENNARLPLEDIAAMLDKPVEEVARPDGRGHRQGLHQRLQDPGGLGRRWARPGRGRHRAARLPKKSRGFDEIATTIASFDEVESVL